MSIRAGLIFHAACGSYYKVRPVSNCSSIMQESIRHSRVLQRRLVSESSCGRTKRREILRIRHQSTRHAGTSASASSATTAPYYPADTSRKYWSTLKNRTVLKLAGPDAANFLHNLIPAPVQPLREHGSLLYSAFLNAKGRIIHDIFIHKPAQDKAEDWYLEVDANSAQAVMSHIKKHKLRSRFELARLSPEEATVVYVWPTHRTSEAVNQDPRPGMGLRYCVDTNGMQKLTTGELKDAEQVQWQDYMIHRMLSGFAEGPVEVSSGSALPQESNMDFCGGIDFQKGCYLGQELTIRTHHTGVVRKRILPVQIYSNDAAIPLNQNAPVYDPSLQLPQPPNEANISKCGATGRAGRSTGKWLGGYGNIGLALCRLEMMTDLTLTAESSQYNPAEDEFQVSWDAAPGENGLDWSSSQSVKVKAFVPPWLRQAIESSKQSRSERSRRNKEYVDEEDDIA